jgi:hypothetical protein
MGVVLRVHCTASMRSMPVSQLPTMPLEALPLEMQDVVHGWHVVSVVGLHTRRMNSPALHALQRRQTAACPTHSPVV